MREAVLFDMDGVLVDSEPHWQRYWQEEIFPEVGGGEPTLEEVTGRNFRESLVKIDEEYGLSADPSRLESEIERFAEEIYRTHESVTEGMPALFSSLRDRDADLAVVSSSPREWISMVVKRSNLDAPDAVVSTEDIAAVGKPEPAVYRHAIDRLGVDPDKCVVVEDSKNGVRAAGRAGTSVIRYQCGHAAEPIPKADHVAEDIAELRVTLLELLRED